MGIFLGNLELKDIVKEKYLNEIKKYLDENNFIKVEKCEEIRSVAGNYHIFDMPRTIAMAGETKVIDFMDFLRKNDLIEKAFIGNVSLTLF